MICLLSLHEREREEHQRCIVFGSSQFYCFISFCTSSNTHQHFPFNKHHQFNITKLQLMEAEKQKIRREFERRESAIEVKKKVERSKQLNESRIKVLQAREDAMQALLREAQVRLANLSKNPDAYKKLLTDLLVQALNKLGEREALVRWRQVDVPLVQQVLPTVGDAYRKKYGSEAPKVSIDTVSYLPPPPQQGQHGNDEFKTCTGGVVVTSSSGKIVCSNTLDDRLKIGYAASVPRIRQMLFES